LLIPSADLKVLSGTPKEITITADSGKSTTNCFCPYCGTTMYRYGDAFGGKHGARVVQAGILDELNVIDKTELVNVSFVGMRVQYVRPLDGVRQCEGTTT
jgi:hypothetical protein